MKITITSIPHAEQRYDTLGDWQGSAANELRIRVSSTGNWRTELLVAIHELIEAALCTDANVSDSDVDRFDMAWKPYDGLFEPGEDENAPYYDQHRKAAIIEKRMAQFLAVDWDEYENELEQVQASWPLGNDND